MFKMVSHVINAMHGFITNVLASQKKLIVQGWQKLTISVTFVRMIQETSEQHTNELEPYESTVEETSLKTVIHNTNDQFT